MVLEFQIRPLFLSSPSRLKSGPLTRKICNNFLLVIRALLKPDVPIPEKDSRPLRKMTLLLSNLQARLLLCKDPPPPLQNMMFDPMAFLKEWGEKMQMMNQQQLQPQTIVVESRVDKSCENEAKYSNHMSQLLFFCGIVDFTPPGSFVAPRILVYMQAMLNILAQPSTVHATHTVNILTRCLLILASI